MTVQFSAEILDSLIAPGVSTLDDVDIPDMSTWAPESRYWLANYFLNSAIDKTYAAPMNAYAFNFLRKAQRAFAEHALARETTMAFVVVAGQSPTLYADALFHWESFLGQAWHALDILHEAGIIEKPFTKGDLSKEQRLNCLYGAMKHVPSRIRTEGQLTPGATVPVWLENNGLRCTDSGLDYVETAEILRDIASVANLLINPKTAKRELCALLERQKQAPS